MTLHCPACKTPLTAETKQAVAREFAAKGNAGRKRSTAPRCPCGEMTARRAEARGHKCATIPASRA